jgi:hypothetical protein
MAVLEIAAFNTLEIDNFFSFSDQLLKSIISYSRLLPEPLNVTLKLFRRPIIAFGFDTFNFKTSL